MTADTLYFSSGANLDGDKATFDEIRVTGDVSGFRNIYANTLNGTNYTTDGRIIADRATVVNSVNVANTLTLKSDSTRTISGFTGIIAHTVLTSYLSTDQIVFYENFGLTISGELLYSTTGPLLIGSGPFPSLTPPRFAVWNLQRAAIPAMPRASDFSAIMSPDWQTAIPVEVQ